MASSFFVQFPVLISQLLLYFFSIEKGEGVSSFVVNWSVATVFISLYASLRLRRRTCAHGFNFSIILFFVMMSAVIAFQVPLEIVYGNEALLDRSQNLVYDVSVVNGLVAFSSLFLNFFLFGVSFSYTKKCTSIKPSFEVSVARKLPAKPILLFVWVGIALFFVTVNSEYLNHGHGRVSLNSISQSAITIISRFSPIYLSIIAFNILGDKVSFFELLRRLRWLYLMAMMLVVFAFFLAHNRMYPIMLATPIVFAFVVILRVRMKVRTVVLCFLALSVFGTLFKIYGIKDFYRHGLFIDEVHTISLYYFPFTAELASSFYSGNVLYSMWYNSGFSLHGASFFVGFLRIIPGVMGLLNVDPSFYSSSVTATLYSGLHYGVGTTAIADLLVNLGVFFSVVVGILLGFLFGRSEVSVYGKNVSVSQLIVYLTITSLILFYPRASFNELIAMVLFNVFFYGFYKIFVTRKRVEYD